MSLQLLAALAFVAAPPTWTMQPAFEPADGVRCVRGGGMLAKPRPREVRVDPGGPPPIPDREGAWVVMKGSQAEHHGPWVLFGADGRIEPQPQLGPTVALHAIDGRVWVQRPSVEGETTGQWFDRQLRPWGEPITVPVELDAFAHADEVDALLPCGPRAVMAFTEQNTLTMWDRAGRTRRSLTAVNGAVRCDARGRVLYHTTFPRREATKEGRPNPVELSALTLPGQRRLWRRPIWVRPTVQRGCVRRPSDDPDDVRPADGAIDFDLAGLHLVFKTESWVLRRVSARSGRELREVPLDDMHRRPRMVCPLPGGRMHRLLPSGEYVRGPRVSEAASDGGGSVSTARFATDAVVAALYAGDLLYIPFDGARPQRLSLPPDPSADRPPRIVTFATIDDGIVAHDSGGRLLRWRLDAGERVGRVVSTPTPFERVVPTARGWIAGRGTALIDITVDGIERAIEIPYDPSSIAARRARVRPVEALGIISADQLPADRVPTPRPARQRLGAQMTHLVADADRAIFRIAEPGGWGIVHIWHRAAGLSPPLQADAVFQVELTPSGGLARGAGDRQRTHHHRIDWPTASAAWQTTAVRRNTPAARPRVALADGREVESGPDGLIVYRDGARAAGFWPGSSGAGPARVHPSRPLVAVTVGSRLAVFDLDAGRQVIAVDSTADGRWQVERGARVFRGRRSLDGR